MGRKPTIQEKYDRLNEVRLLLNNGMIRSHVCFELSKRWGIGYRAVDSYVTVVYKQIRDHFKDNNGKEDLLAKLNQLYAEAKDAGERAVATKILDSIAKITGANAVEKTETTHIINVIVPNEDD